MDYAKRADVEAALARRVGRFNRDEVRDLLEKLGDPPLVENVIDFWPQYSAKLSQLLRPALEEVFLDMVRQAMDVYAALDETVINERAARWASQYTNELITGMVSNRQSELRRAVAAFYEEKLTIGELRDRLVRAGYSARHAEKLAITETTRAASAGEAAYVDELRRTHGVRMRAFWVTNRDDRVCPICSPLDGTEQGVKWSLLPPVHARCRCYVRYEAGGGDDG